ncbi:MAG: 2-succinyl-5-enolpyruvyl-6-hydroxy-3-cyclohexene-carboxylate synthase [Solirubrobacterales bacterium]|jgi:2-succinyl-5-enolpyruvyl-6-hydroxy-3-cyclohexene-1-carboxylate synthase|nr:2-succinyl-5-enolpyruvyl-6-hydroxy-3-cyclohexene-carboxylate synthase [Solirubrobacterales bacterium]
MDPTNRNTALASALVEELARSGVRQAVICPGSRSTPIALALLSEPGIATTSVVDERSAGFFALGAALASDLPVAIACTSGTAAANLHPAVAEANEASVPLIALTSDRPPELRGVGAGQTIDQVKLYGSSVRWFCEMGTHDADDVGLLHMRSSACRAFAEATGDPRPGPVHLNLSWRDPLGPEPVEGDVTATSPVALEGRGDLPLNSVHSPALTLDAAALDAISADLAETERGLIVAGRQTDPALAPAIAVLAAASGYPVLAEPTSQLRLDPDLGSDVIWAYDSIARARPEDLVPDVVIRFGDMPTSKALRQWLGSLDQAAQLVVDPAGTWNDPTRTAGLSLRADPALLAIGLAARLDEGQETPFAAKWRLANESAAAAIRAELSRFGGEPTEPGAYMSLGAALRDGDVVFCASSMPIRDAESFLPASERDVIFLSNRGANGIDGTVSSAIGAAVATGSPAWVVIGDLALHHDTNGLALLRHAPAPVRIVCLNNDGGGIFEFLPQASQVTREEFEAVFGTPLGLDLSKLAALHGIEHRRIAGLDELAGAGASGHVLIEVPVDREKNVAVHEALWLSVASRLNSLGD